MPIESITKQNITDEIFRQMQSQILDGEWKTGSKIPSEKELGELFGASRIAVREALKKLLALDLVETRPGSGTYVKEISAGIYANSLIPLILLDKPNIKHMIEFRRAIEIENVRMATERATESDIDQLARILDTMEKHVGDSKGYSECDLNFHLEIAKMTCNPLIIKVSLLIKDIMLSVMSDTTTIFGYNGLTEHKDIFDAIKSRNGPKARRLMRQHFERILKQLEHSEKPK